MALGKRWREWEQVAKVCQATLWPHASPAERRRAGKLEIIPADLAAMGGRKSTGMTRTELKSMRGGFKDVVTVSAADVRVRPSGEDVVS